jgi:UDP-sugar transporter A1/2/3
MGAATFVPTTPSPSRRHQALALFILTIQNTALVLVTKFSYRQSATPYVVSTVISSAELVKLVLSCVLLVASDGQSAARDALREVPSNAARLAVPSVLYVIQNNLLFEGVRMLSPTAYMVCSQSKILTSAFCSVLLLGTQITRKQYVALLVLVCGMVMVQGEEGRGQNVPSDRARMGDTLRGMIVVLTAAFTSGFAGAYLEKIYKEVGAKKRSIWFRNAQLACFSLPVAMIGSAWCDGERLRTNEGVFQGYDSVVLLVIALQAVGGLVVAAVLRYAGNVLKCFAVSISICNCAVASTFLSTNGGYGLSTSTTLGIALVIGSTFLYSNVV